MPENEIHQKKIIAYLKRKGWKQNRNHNYSLMVHPSFTPPNGTRALTVAVYHSHDALAVFDVGNGRQLVSGNTFSEFVIIFHRFKEKKMIPQ
jgi:hypothetical protein